MNATLSVMGSSEVMEIDKRAVMFMFLQKREDFWQKKFGWVKWLECDRNLYMETRLHLGIWTGCRWPSIRVLETTNFDSSRKPQEWCIFISSHWLCLADVWRKEIMIFINPPPLRQQQPCTNLWVAIHPCRKNASSSQKSRPSKARTWSGSSFCLSFGEPRELVSDGFFGGWIFRSLGQRFGIYVEKKAHVIR